MLSEHHGDVRRKGEGRAHAPILGRRGRRGRVAHRQGDAAARRGPARVGDSVGSGRCRPGTAVHEVAAHEHSRGGGDVGGGTGRGGGSSGGGGGTGQVWRGSRDEVEPHPVRRGLGRARTAFSGGRGARAQERVQPRSACRGRNIRSHRLFDNARGRAAGHPRPLPLALLRGGRARLRAVRRLGRRPWHVGGCPEAARPRPPPWR